MSLEKQFEDVALANSAVAWSAESFATAARDQEASKDVDVRHRISDLRPILVAYARKQVASEHWIQDAVSATMLAALERPDAFLGRSRLLSWLVGILKHKLIDEIRLSRRHTQAIDVEYDDEFTPMRAASAVDEGCVWTCLHREQRLLRISKCAESLTGIYRQVFVMKDLLQLETDDICARLQVSNNYFFVLLHRARQQVRTCALASPCNGDTSTSHPRRRRLRHNS